jgi:hypothetical protein
MLIPPVSVNRPLWKTPGPRERMSERHGHKCRAVFRSRARQPGWLGVCAPENGTIFQLATLPQERRSMIEEGLEYPLNRPDFVLPRRLLDSKTEKCRSLA